MKNGYRYYVAIGVHRSDALAFKILDFKSAEIDLAADVKHLVEGRIGLKAAGDCELVIKSDKPLAYGVELSELVYNPRRTRLELAATKDFVHTMAPGEELPGSARSMIGDPQDSIVLEFEENGTSKRNGRGVLD